MAKPQQPEVRRSGKVPALDPDATETKRTADRRHDATDPDGPIPEDQRPGHHPDHDQDKPDMDAFAERLGVVSEDDEPDDAPAVERDTTVAEATKRAKGSTDSGGPSLKLLVLAPAIGFVVVRRIIREVKKRT